MEPQRTSEHSMERRDGPKSSWIPLLLGTILFVAYLFLPGCGCNDSDCVTEQPGKKPSL
ncbi:unnamed protein product, partial [marine sediment metagenome]